MRICIDLDDTLCRGKPYNTATPLPGAKEFLQRLKDDGHEIVIYTARFMGRTDNNQKAACEMGTELTINQLREWEFPYDEIYLGKPSADLYIDDKSISGVDYNQILKFLEC